MNFYTIPHRGGTHKIPLEASCSGFTHCRPYIRIRRFNGAWSDNLLTLQTINSLTSLNISPLVNR